MNKIIKQKSAILGIALIMAVMFSVADMPFVKTEAIYASENNGDEGTFPWNGEFSTTTKNVETTKKTPQTTRNTQQTTTKNQLTTTKENDKSSYVDNIKKDDKNTNSFSNTEESAAKSNVNIPKAKITKIKIKSPKKISVKLKKIKGVSGYQIKISTTNKFKGKATKTYSSKKNIVSIKKLKIGNRYFVKARGYKFSDGVKYYGKWSKIKTVR